MKKTEIKKKFFKFFIFLFSILYCLFSVGYADFADLGVGARQQGLGNAFVGISDDVSSIYYNPAGLGFLRRGEFIADYSRLYIGLDDESNLNNGFLGVVYPLKFRKNYGAVGIGLLNFSFSGVYQENSFYISYGKKVLNKLSLGGNIKFLSESYTQDDYTKIDPVFEYGKKSSLQTFGMDIGGIYNFLPRFFYGFTFININQPDIGLRKSEKLPIIFKMGVGYKEKDLNVGFDFILRDKDNIISFGFERWFFKHQFGVRTGFEFGSREYRKLAVGSSYDSGTIRIDYAFSLPLVGIKDTYGIHRISVGYKFGRIPEDELEPGSLEEAFYRLQQEAKQLKETLRKTESEKAKLEKVLIDEAIIRAKERIKEIKTEPVKELPVRRVEEPKDVQTIRYHTVKENDTLQALAQKYYGDSNKWIEIFNSNKDKVGRGGSLTVGQVLVIPPLVKTQISEEKIQPSVPSKIEEKPVPVPSEKTRVHIVREGETLPVIAQKYYGDPSRWVDIYKANKDKIPRGKVEPGQELIIP